MKSYAVLGVFLLVLIVGCTAPGGKKTAQPSSGKAVLPEDQGVVAYLAVGGVT